VSESISQLVSQKHILAPVNLYIEMSNRTVAIYEARFSDKDTMLNILKVSYKSDYNPKMEVCSKLLYPLRYPATHKVILS